MPDNTLPFALDTSGNSYQHSVRLGELQDLMGRTRRPVAIRIMGHGGMHPTDCLAYLDVVAMCGSSYENVGVQAYCNLLGAGDLAVWLGLGMRRDIRPSAIVWVPSEPIIVDMRYYHALPLSWDTAAAMLQRDHDQCLERISEHVHLDLVLDRMLTRADLIDLLLIGDTPEIDRLMAKPPPPRVEPPLPPAMQADAISADAETDGQEED